MTAMTITGSGGGGGKSGASGGGLNETGDNLKSTSYAQLLDLLCEGEIDGLVNGAKSIYVDETALQNADGTYNFSDVQWVSTTGTQAQAAITGSEAVRNEISVNVEAKANTPVVRSITNLNVNAVIVTVQFPQMTYMDDKGNLGGTSVEYAIDIQNNGGGWQQAVYRKLSGKSSSSYERQHRITLPAGGPWDFRLRRISPDSTKSSLNNKTWLKSYTEVIDVKLRYPNCALVGVRVDASQFKSIPARAYDVKLLRIRIPTNATVQSDGSLVYTGSWDGTFKVAWSSCPAWCFYDAITANRYGLGRYIPATMVDKWSLYTISKYCNAQVPNGFGGTEPRFSCNLFIDSAQEAFKFINDMASIFRAMPYWSSGSITVAQDSPADPAYLFTNANVEGGKFTYQGSSAKARHTVALVQWNDPADMCRSKVEYVEDSAGIARYGVVETQVVAVGCTSRGQANRVGRWLLYTERMETDTVTFKTGSEGILIAPGQTIKVADQYRAGQRLGGRITSAGESSVVLDHLEAPPALPATLYVTHADGSVTGHAVDSINGQQVSIAGTFSSTPVSGGMWALASAALDAQTFRVLSAAEADGVYEVSALEHEPSKFGAIENGLVLEQRNYTSLSPVPAPVATVALAESLYRQQNTVRAKVTVSWPAAANATSYLVRWRENSGGWYEATTSSLDMDILDTKVASYEVSVTSIGAFGSPARTATTASINALGKTAPPSNVASITAVVDAQIGVTLNWAGVTDLDLDRYELRSGVSWDAGSVVAQVAATTYKVGAIAAGAQTFWVKAIDTTGIYSTTAAGVTTNIAAPSTPLSVNAQVIDNNVLLRWGASSGTLAIDGYEIRRGASYASATVVGIIKGTFIALFETASGGYTYWVTALDIAGNRSTGASVAAQVAQPPDYTLLTDYQSPLSGTKSNAAVDSGGLYIGVNSAETWQGHFDARGWASPQDQTNAGYPAFAEPVAESGYYEEVMDYGTTVAACKISVQGNWVTELRAPTIGFTISTSNTSATGPWTDYVGSEAYASQFRWVKVRVTATGGAVSTPSLSIKLDAKQKEDFGKVIANAADDGGTVVNFSQTFVDVSAILVVPQGNQPLTAIYDFFDTQNPKSFRVLLYNSAGARVSGTVSWTARGY